MVTSVQKKGRVSGKFPEDDARVIDQFMDDVIAQFTENASPSSVTNIINLIRDEQLVIDRFIDKSFTIVDPTTVLQRNPVLDIGVTITIETGGELFIL